MYKKDDFNTDKCQFEPIQGDFIRETEVYVTQCCTPMNGVAFCFKQFSLWLLGKEFVFIAVFTCEILANCLLALSNQF